MHPCSKPPRTHSFKLLLGAAHAPHSGHLEQDLETWRTTLKLLTSRYAQGRELVLLMDCNAKVGAQIDPAFGGLSEDQENSDGHRRRDFANSLFLCAPASFPHILHKHVK